jgi:DUF4097 and DUF4098 domain-containing protein YvlB
MKTKLPALHQTTALAVALLAFVASPARADVEDKITKSYTVQPGGQLAVEVDRGSIEVKTSADRRSVDIEVTRKSRGSEAKAAKVLNDHVVTTAQDGNKVEVRAEYKGPKASGWFGRSPDLQVNYVITIPREFTVNLKTAGGNIKVADLAGKAQVHTSGGSLTLEKIEGPISGHTSGGNINIAGCRGTVDVHTSGGTLNLSEIEGDVTGKTSGGSIRAENLTGKTIVKTSGGSIGVTGIKGSIDASTSGGSVNAELIEPPTEACSFRSSGGSITVALAGNVAVDVDLHTSGGRVSTDFPVVSVIQGEQQKNEIRGKVNGGGPLITARTSGGSVRLQKK